MKKNLPENKPTQWEIGQPSDVFSKNPVKIKIPLGLLQRGVTNEEKSLWEPVQVIAWFGNVFDANQGFILCY